MSSLNLTWLSFLSLPYPRLTLFPLLSYFQSSSGREVYSVPHTGRHLLDFSPEAEAEEATGAGPLGGGPSAVDDR